MTSNSFCVSDFGLPLSIILTLTIFTLFIKASKKIIAMKKTSEFYIDKAFLASSFNNSLLD